MWHPRKGILFLGIVAVLVIGFTLTIGVAVAQEEEAIPLEITMGDLFFQLEGQEPGEAITLQAGQLYELRFTNAGALAHEAWLGSDVIVQDDLAQGYSTNLLKDVEVVVGGLMNDQPFEVVTEAFRNLAIQPGQALSVRFALPEDLAGEWELGCFVPGHYEGGMKAPIIVEAA